LFSYFLKKRVVGKNSHGACGGAGTDAGNDWGGGREKENLFGGARRKDPRKKKKVNRREGSQPFPGLEKNAFGAKTTSGKGINQKRKKKSFCTKKKFRHLHKEETKNLDGS